MSTDPKLTGGATQTVTPTGGVVYSPPTGPGAGVQTVTVFNDGGFTEMTVDQVLASIDDIEANYPDIYDSLSKLVVKNGFSNFEDALNIASYDQGKDGRSWEEFLSARAENPAIKAAYDKKQGGGSGGAYSQTNTQRTLSNVTQAGAYMDNAFKSELGRTGSKEEAAAFQKALNEQQSKNATVSRTSGYSNGKGSSSSNTVTTGGFDPTRFAQEYARSQEGYAERYAGISFMKILDDAISNPNSIDKIVGGSFNG